MVSAQAALPEDPGSIPNTPTTLWALHKSCGAHIQYSQGKKKVYIQLSGSLIQENGHILSEYQI